MIIPKSLITPYLIDSNLSSSSTHQLLSYYLDLFIIELNSKLLHSTTNNNNNSNSNLNDEDQIGNVIMQIILDFC